MKTHLAYPTLRFYKQVIRRPQANKALQTIFLGQATLRRRGEGSYCDSSEDCEYETYPIEEQH